MTKEKLKDKVYSVWVGGVEVNDFYHSMAMKWLREVHNLIITIDYDEYEMPFNKHKVGYGYSIQQTTNPTEFLKIGEKAYNSYEEACEYAIIDCLTNLI